MRKPLLTVVLATQVLFALACGAPSGVSQTGNEAGQDVQLDDTPAPSAPERPDLVDDHRCDWLGTPFASVASNQTYVLRSTDRRHDCNGANEPEQKVIFNLGSSPRPILDVSDLDDVRIVDTDVGLLVFSERDQGGEQTWLIEHTTGAILDETELPLRISRTATSPNRNWVAVGEDFRTLDHLMIQLLDPTTLTLHALTNAGQQGAYAWAGEELLATVEVTADATRIALWDTTEGIPTTPVFESWIEDTQVHAFDPIQLVVSPDGRFIAFEVRDTVDGVAILDREDGTIQRHVGFDGGLAFTAEGLLVGGMGSLIQVADPVLRTAHSIELDFQAVVVLSETGSDALLVPLPQTPCEPEEPEEEDTRSGGFFDDFFSNLADAADDCVEPEDLILDPQLVRLDLISGEQTELGQGSGISSYSRRDGEIWLVTEGTVVRVELDEAVLTELPTTTARRVLYLPGSDRIYTDRTDAPVVHLFDPEQLTVVQSFDLSRDFIDATSVLERH